MIQWPKEKGQKGKQHLQNIYIKLKIEQHNLLKIMG